MPSPVQVLDQQLRLLQADVRILKTSIQGVDVLTRSGRNSDGGYPKADVVAIAEKVASSAVASVRPIVRPLRK
jgi:hypothetical protein